MNLLRDLTPFDSRNHIRIVVESPRGAAVKLKYDPATNLFVWSRGLPTGVSFPNDFGFIPQTLAGDGDALDALVLGSSAGFPGVVVPCRLLGALRVFQTRNNDAEKDNHRVLCVPANEHRFADITQPPHLGTRRLAELEAFFRASLALTGKQIRLAGWADASEARALLDEAHAAFK